MAPTERTYGYRTPVAAPAMDASRFALRPAGAAR
jgi:hypothetical protein